MLKERPGPEVGRADGSPHVSWGMHLFNEQLAVLCRHENLINPSRTLLDNEVYVHQSRINIKQTNGSIVAWHQDFGTYHRRWCCIKGVMIRSSLMMSSKERRCASTGVPMRRPGIDRLC